jgi:hypothetical protein
MTLENFLPFALEQRHLFVNISVKFKVFSKLKWPLISSEGNNSSQQQQQQPQTTSSINNKSSHT